MSALWSFLEQQKVGQSELDRPRGRIADGLVAIIVSRVGVHKPLVIESTGGRELWSLSERGLPEGPPETSRSPAPPLGREIFSSPPKGCSPFGVLLPGGIPTLSKVSQPISQTIWAQVAQKILKGVRSPIFKSPGFF